MKDLKFYETYVLENVQYLASLDRKTISSIIKNNNNPDDDSSYNYVESLLIYFKRIIRYNAELQITYKFSEGCTEGRLYSNGLSFQSIPDNIRRFIMTPDYIDYDMRNCHPTLLLYLAKQNPSLKSYDYNLLNDYVVNRDALLAEHNLDKRTVIKNLYTDYPRSKNAFLILLNKQLKMVKRTLVKDLTLDTSKKNPISSKISKLINVLENSILENVLLKSNLVGDIKQGALCFDGFLCKSNIDIKDLDSQTKEYGITWSIKPNKTDIEKPDDFTPNMYKIIKSEFELNNFIVLQPFSFFTRVGTSFYPYKESDFLKINSTHPLIDDTKFTTLWLSDFERRQYDFTNFFPYGKNTPNIPKKTFNTFTPFARIESLENPIVDDFDDFLNNYFLVLIHHLAERDKEMANNLVHYIAHMIQYPDVLPETIIYLKGDQGIGKDTLLDIIDSLICNKEYIYRTKNLESVFGRFNSAIRNNICLGINEMSNREAIRYQHDIKDYSTREVNNIEVKGIDGIYKINNFSRVFIISNDNKPVCLTASSRRENVNQGFCVSLSGIDKAEFFNKIRNYMKNEKIMDNLFAYLYNTVDLTDYNPRVFKRGRLFKTLSCTNVKPVFDWLRNQDWDDVVLHKDGDVIYPCKQLVNEYNMHCDENNIPNKLNPDKMKIELDCINTVINEERARIDGKRVNVWKFKKENLVKYINETFFKYETKDSVISEDDLTF